MDINQKLGLGVLALFVITYLSEFLSGRLRLSRQPGRDVLFSLFGIFAQTGVSGPVLGIVTGWTLIKAFPDSAGAWADWLLLPTFLGFILLEDFIHYWLHRYSHEWRWLWKLHRTHHSGTAMNVGLVFRYNLFWTLILPQSWITALLIYTGQEMAALLIVLTTFSINLLTHMSFRWDLWLLERFPVIKPLWSVLVRVVTTPDTHHAHHGMGREAHARGNYAVVFFLWDTLFGTGKIPGQEQTRIGLPHSGRLHWAEELLWPLVKKPVAPRDSSLNP